MVEALPPPSRSSFELDSSLACALFLEFSKYISMHQHVNDHREHRFLLISSFSIRFVTFDHEGLGR